MAKSDLTKRDKGGRWLKGGSPKSPGRPRATKAARMKCAILDATSIAQAQRIFKNLAIRAENGEPWAVKLYLRYIAGDPKHMYDPRQGLPADEAKAPQEQISLRDQEIFLRGALAQVQATMRAEQGRGDGDG